ncbi:hypothetical protein ACI3KS_09955 [Microbacterium sp. ZW T5_45]|uniref:hypothetical protein n=1 Tax=Microbacterium sp. ZW T5_45 TaxID=3378080 RepID=UPI00385560D8
MRRALALEIVGWTAALAVSVSVAAQVASSARSGLVYRDGDSLVVAMLARSVLSGAPLDWAMSSVLFLPETAVFGALDAALPADLNSLLAINAVVNLLALYGALRLAAGRRRDGSAPVMWSLIALVAFGVIGMTETSPSRDALDLASLQLTTTYYSATVVAVVLVIGLLRRSFDGAGRVTLVFAACVSALATLSNPLFPVWAVVPMSAFLAFRMLRERRAAPTLAMLFALIGGTVVGLIGRIPFSAWIANTGVGYAQPELWRESIGYYGELLLDRVSTPLGALGSVIVIGLIAWAVVRTLRATSPGERLLAAAGWLLPLLVVIGAIALGTHAARYLQPVVFAPLLALVAAPRAQRPSRPLTRATAAAGVLLLLVGGFSIPRLSASAQAPDDDLSCVTDWVETSGRTGAGQFWTVRLPKAHLDNPAQLVQVDHRLDGYAWLVNRTDLDVGEVSFLVEDAQSTPWELPVGADPDAVVDCGRYRILDFASSPLPIGPAHS